MEAFQTESIWGTALILSLTTYLLFAAFAVMLGGASGWHSLNRWLVRSFRRVLGGTIVSIGMWIKGGKKSK